MQTDVQEASATPAGPEISLPSRLVVRMLDRILELPLISAHAVQLEPGMRLAGTPRIGDAWFGEGGFYAGVIRGVDGPDRHVIVARSSVDPDVMTWEAAKAWAAGVRDDGLEDFRLPTRREQALLYANVPELFEKEWYWSGEQRAEYPEYAWLQTFDYGFQHYDLTGYEYRARAVRSFPI